MMSWFVDALTSVSLWAALPVVFLALVLCGVGLPMPEDVVLVTGGVLAWLASNEQSVSMQTMIRDPRLWSMIVVGYLGIIGGDSATFWAGRLYGSHIAEHRMLRRVVTPQKRERVEALLRRWGTVAVLIARFLPGLRAPTYFMTGHARLPYWRFLLLDSVAALASAPIWVCLGYYFGDDIGQAIHHAREVSRHMLLGALVLVCGIVFVVWWRWRQRQERVA
jgi:membrane protein DedA with SNARE-associated domain